MSAPNPPTRFFTARINENGRIVIPAAVRDQMGLKPGEPVVMEIDADNILRLESHHAHIRRLQQEFSEPTAQPPIRPPAEEISTEEAALPTQMEEWLG